ncbi:MAG TPA: hypothetical protein VFA22_06305 [Stellaceae bacterium]|nr:hypothetical protein [Stellaceae bacterium]
MTDAPAIAASAAAPVAAATVIPPNAVAPGTELPNALLLLQEAANFAATVIGRDADGAMLLRSGFGLFSLKTTLPLDPGTRVELRYQPGNPPSLALLGVAETEAPEPAAPPMQLDLGTETAATVIAAGSDPAAALPVGTRLLLRILPQAAAGAPSTLAGQIVPSAGGETIVETPLGTLALDLRIALPPGTAMAFGRLHALPSATPADAPPSQAAGWPALDQVLAALDRSAPALAQQMRASLSPANPAAFTATLLFLAGALYRGRWPGEPVARALASAGEGRLQQQLASDLSELSRLSTDRATDPWRVLVLPLLTGTTVAPLRLYLRRQPDHPQDGGDGGTRFVFEAELSRIGPLQLDGRVQGSRLDLVLRSHASLAPDLRQEAAAIFRRASAANGLHGDIVFATASEFSVAPMRAQQRRVEVRA